MLIYLGMLLLSYAGYRIGKLLWVKSVGATWVIVPALLAYLFAFWMLFVATLGTGGAALLPALAVWGGLWVGKYLAQRGERQRRRETSRAREEAPWRLK